mmetsp:Transcript_3846/g.8356  ORF Transcript_3846/g.8356 Transcript_3846/m.8356 type:complete len:739 (+) Transcript_3846:81-2297(+)
MNKIDEMEEKALQLEALLAQPTLDLWKLREHALGDGGLVNDSIRQRAWPALCGLHDEAVVCNKSAAAQAAANNSPRAVATSPIDLSQNAPSFDELSSNQSPKKSNDYTQQVELDVQRCTWHLLTGNQRVQRLQMEHKRNKRIARVIKKKQGRLASCIQKVLAASDNGNDNHPSDSQHRLHYYQGYHDVACIFLSTLRDAAPPKAWAMVGGEQKSDCHDDTRFDSSKSLGLDLPSAVLLQVSQSHLIDCMQDTFQPLQATLLWTIMPLLALLDTSVHGHLADCEMAPFFALSWIISWFSHDIRDTALCKRLFDAFISSHPAFPIYLSVAMLLHPYNRQLIVETPCDFAAVHHALSSLPKNSSTVGWKFQPGTGYVSDDDTTTTTNTSTSTMDDEHSYNINGNESDNTIVRMTDDDREGELVLIQAGIDLCEGGCMVDTISLNSSSLSRGEDSAMSSPVPFQELIDMAVQFMHRIPPRKLKDLATRYHGKQAVEEMISQPLREVSSPLSMRMLQDPAPWTLSPRTPTQRLLKAQARKLRGSPPRQHQHKSKQQKSSIKSSDRPDSQNYMPTIPPSDYVSYLRRAQYKQQHRSFHSTMAFVASGMALTKKEQKRQAQRQRVGMIVIAFLVACLAWWFGVPPQTARAPETTTMPVPPLDAQEPEITTTLHSVHEEAKEILTDIFTPAAVGTTSSTLHCSSCALERADDSVIDETAPQSNGEALDEKNEVLFERLTGETKDEL